MSEQEMTEAFEAWARRSNWTNEGISSWREGGNGALDGLFSIYSAGWQAASARMSERVRELEEALLPFVDCNFTYLDHRVIGTDARLTDEVVERARAALKEPK